VARVLTGRISFLSPNQQCQATEENSTHRLQLGKITTGLRSSFLDLPVGLLMEETLILLCRLFDASTLSSTEWAKKRHIFTSRRYASTVYAVALCLSVCLSQVGVLPKQLMTETTLHDSQGTLVFWCQGSSWNFDGDHFQGGRRLQVG